MGVDIASLDMALTAAALPVVGVAYCTHEAREAHVAAQDPVVWVGLADAEVRLDLTRDLTPEEQVEAEGLILAWAAEL